MENPGEMFSEPIIERLDVIASKLPQKRMPGPVRTGAGVIADPGTVPPRSAEPDARGHRRRGGERT
jgi:hypothetical protein